MSDVTLFDCAIRLCGADQISGFIPASPVVDSREKIIENRLKFLLGKMNDIYSLLSLQYNNGYRVMYVINKATELTVADIISGVIAVDPVAYEREERITESIQFYFHLLWKGEGNVIPIVAPGESKLSKKIMIKKTRRKK